MSLHQTIQKDGRAIGRGLPQKGDKHEHVCNGNDFTAEPGESGWRSTDPHHAVAGDI